MFYARNNELTGYIPTELVNLVNLGNPELRNISFVNNKLLNNILITNLMHNGDI
jgi:hypothetical protein